MEPCPQLLALLAPVKLSNLCEQGKWKIKDDKRKEERYSTFFFRVGMS